MDTTTVTCSLPAKKSTSYKWLLGLTILTVIALGWRYPVLGFIVPIAMTAGIVGGFLKGRWVCGNLCPRGSFFDSWFSAVSGNRETPGIIRNPRFRWLLLTALMSFMVFRLSQDPSNMTHWGLVFWQMCTLTTVVAVTLGVRYSARSWCSTCPVGTIAASAGKGKYPLQVSSACKVCGLCEEACPMQLEVTRFRHTGKSEESDCIKCSECISACPRKDVLSWPHKEAA